MKCHLIAESWVRHLEAETVENLGGRSVLERNVKVRNEVWDRHQSGVLSVNVYDVNLKKEKSTSVESIFKLKNSFTEKYNKD